MPVLGDLFIRIKVTGEGEATATINKINQSASNTGRNFSAANISAAQLFATLARGSGSATTGIVNFGDGVKVANNNFLDLIQSAGILLGLFKNISIKNPLKDFSKMRTGLMWAKGQTFTTAGGGGRQFGDGWERAAPEIFGMASRRRRDFVSSLTDMVGPTRAERLLNIPGFEERIREKAKAFRKKFLGTFFFFQDDPNRMKYAENFIQVIDSLLGPIHKFKYAFNSLSEQAGFSKFGRDLKFLGAEFKKDFMSFFGGLIKETLQFHTVSFAVTIPAITAITVASVEAAAALEKMQAKLKATLMGQGMTKGGANVLSGQMMGAIKTLSEPSTYTAQQIGEAAQRMEAFGLNSVKVLNTGLKLAEVFGGMPDDLEMVVRMFGRMASGDLPDVEVLSRFGINKTDLNATSMRKYGKNIVDPDTKKLAGTAAEGVEVLLELIKERYSKLADEMRNTLDARVATLQERFTNLLEVIGQPLIKSLIPLLENIEKFISKLISSGSAEQFGMAVAKIIDAFSQPENFKKFQDFAVFLIAYLQESAVEIEKLVYHLAGLGDIIRGVVKLIAGIKTFGISFFTSGTGISEITSGFKNVIKGGPLSLPGFFLDNVNQRFNDISKEMSLNTVLPKGNLDPFLNSPTMKRSVEIQEDIKENTARAADALELRKANLGGRGGPLAQLGMGINVNQAGTTAGVMRAAIPPSFALLNPVNQLQKSIQMEVFRTTNQQYLRRF